MADPKPGDEVRVFDHTSGRRTEEFPGEVVKTGRTLVTIAYGSAKPYRNEAKFRMDTGRIADNYGGVWFLPPEQAAAEARAECVLEVIKAAGLEVKLGHRPSGALLEAIAATIEAFERD